MNSLIRNCIRGSVQLQRSYGIAAGIHLIDGKNLAAVQVNTW